MTIRTSLYRMTERAIGGNLAERLCTLRDDEGESFEAIARRWHAEYGVEVTGQTLRIWHRQLVAEPEGDVA